MNPFFRRLRARLSYQNLSIRYKLILALIIVALVPQIFFIGVQTVVRYFSAVENIESSLEQQAQLTGLVIERNVESQLNNVLSAVQNARLRSRTLYLLLTASARGDLPNNSTTIEAMTTQLEAHPQIKMMRLLDTTGQLLALVGDVAQYPGQARAEQQGNPSFVQIVDLVLTSEQPVMLTPYIDPETQQLTLEAASPVIEGTTLHGYLIFTLDSSTILGTDATVAENANEARTTTEDIYTYLLDQNGWLLTPVGDAQPFSRQLTLESVSQESEESVGFTAQYERDWGDGAVLVTGRHFPLTATGWTVVAEVPMSALGTPLLVENLTASVPTLIVLLLVLIPLIVVLTRQTVRPIQRLTEAARRIAGGELDTPLPVMSQLDEIGALNNAFAAMSDQVRGSIHGLEQRVKARTRDLALITEIGREALSFGNVDQLLDTTVNRIVTSFAHIYHAQVFLVDEATEYAVLAASTGEVGRDLLRQGHRLPIGSLSVIGRVTQLGETVIARDTASSGVHHKNEYLPDTRAELALPLIYEGRVLGALDVQSAVPDVFAAEEQVLFEALAAQLAIAIHNNRTFTDMNKTMGVLNAENRRLTFQSWQQAFGRREQGILDVAIGPSGFQEGGEFSAWQHRAIRERDMVISPPNAEGLVALAIPLMAGNQVLGVIEWQIPAERLTELDPPARPHPGQPNGHHDGHPAAAGAHRTPGRTRAPGEPGQRPDRGRAKRSPHLTDGRGAIIPNPGDLAGKHSA